MNTYKIIPTRDNSTGCALVAANDITEAINTYKNSLNYRKRFYSEGLCKIDVIACLDCKTNHPCVLMDCIKL